MSILSEYNRDVSGWTRDTLRKTKNRTLRLVLDIGPGYNNQTAGTKQYMGEANKIIFTFPFYMVFVHKGAGKGYGGVKTGLFTRASGNKGTTNAASMGKMGTGKRIPKPWFNPVIEEQFPALSNIVSEYRGAQANLFIKRILID